MLNGSKTAWSRQVETWLAEVGGIAPVAGGARTLVDPSAKWLVAAFASMVNLNERAGWTPE